MIKVKINKALLTPYRFFGNSRDLSYPYGLNQITMTKKSSSTAFKTALFTFLFASVFVIACNNDKKTESTEEKKADTTAPAPTPADTTHKDTAGVRPVVPAN